METKELAEIISGALNKIIEEKKAESYSVEELSKFLEGERPDGISNVEYVLKIIRDSQSTKWNDYIADNNISNTPLNKEAVVDYIVHHSEEKSDILDSIDISADDIPDYVKEDLREDMVDDWFSTADGYDICNKIPSDTEKDVIQNMIDSHF